ncbi:hypothetical protein JKP88DRAFT_164721, partial [Tribonema minus]
MPGPLPPEYATMNLTAGGVCTVPKEQTSRGWTVRRLATRDVMRVDDIDGARTHIPVANITKRPDLYNVNDISGACSLRLHRESNKPDTTLLCADVNGLTLRRREFLRTERHVDPLDPDYKLPSYTAAPPPQPKFVRDSYSVDDIEGTHPKPLYRYQQRENHSADDIEGTKCGWKPRHARARAEAPPLDYALNVKDITDSGFKTQRCTNPLVPVYRCYGKEIADDPVESRPRALPPQKNAPFFSLTTADIEGAQPGWKPPTQLHPPLEQRRHWRNTNYVGDIRGASADSVRHAIRTDRHVDPLNPLYRSLDGEPMGGPTSPRYRSAAYDQAAA